MTINNLFSAVAKTLCLVTLTFFSTNAFGQIKIDASGRILVGPSVASNFDPDTVLSMSIQGKKTSLNNAGSKLGFGDFGIYAPYGGGWNAFIGE